MIRPASPDDAAPELWQLFAMNITLACIIVVAGAEAVRSALQLWS